MSEPQTVLKTLEDESAWFFWNVGKRLPIGVAYYPRVMESNPQLHMVKMWDSKKNT